MESDTNDTPERWYPGDQVLAPFSKDGKLYEATVKTISTDEHGKTVAIVKFSSFNDETVLINTLRRRKKKEPFQGSIFDDEDLEKPFFHDKKPPGPAVSLKLSEDGVCVPYTINRYLRDYQRNGIKFLYKHYISGKGCILGDDMGLGKTIQVISFLAAVLHKRGTREDIENNMPEFVLKSMKKESRAIHDKIFLIVAPLSVLYNWKEELETWGYFRVYILHGNKKDHAFRGIRRKKCEIALTTYETLRLCLNDINSIEWSAVFVDEAHKIKNPKAQITQAMKALKCRVRIGLTGTILQNNVEELWCVMDWAVTGCLGNRSRFKEDFGNPIEFGQRHTATKRELAMGRKAMRKLAKQMSYWFLRRTKAIISDQLPKKDDRVVYCSLTEFQKMVYQAVLQTEDIMLVLRGWDPCDCNSGRKRKSCCYKQNQYGNTVRQIYFSYLALLRKVSNHVALLQPDDSTSKMQASTVKRVCEQVFHKFPEFVQQSKQAAFETISDPKYSGKMKVLQLLLEHFRRNHDKVLLFSLSTKLLDVLEKYCMAAGLDYRRLDGGTKSEERVRIVKEFNSTQDINICLVSTMAGGLGLNFVGANIVVMFDATWNPANDLQAIDRVYRIGQCRDVKVFRLISLGTVEEIMYLRQVYKQQLHCAVVGSENAKRYFSAVQGSKEHPGELFGIHNLFRFRTGGACLTRDIMKREGQVEAGMMTAATQLREEPPAPKLETTMDTRNDVEEDNGELIVEFEKENTSAIGQPAQLFDFSSDSETEPSLVTKSKNDKGRTKETSNSADMRGQLTLLQCGFSKLLEGKIDTREECSENDSSSDNESSDSQCEEETSSNVIGAPLAKADLRLNYTTTSEPQSAAHGHTLCAKEKVCQNWSDSSDSEADLRSEHEHPGTSGNAAVALGTDSNTEESDDVILPSQAAEQKKKTLAKKKTGRDFLSEDLESSDDTIQYNTKLHLYSAFQVGRTSQGAGQSGISDNEKFTSISSKNNTLLPCKHSGFSRAKAGVLDQQSMLAKGKHSSDTLQIIVEDSVSDESDDIEISTEMPAKKVNQSKHTAEEHRKGFCNKPQLLQNTAHHDSSEDSENIGEFTSSGEDVPIKRTRLITEQSRVQFCHKPRPEKVAKGKAKWVKFKEGSPQHIRANRKWSHEEQAGSMDKLLGDVQEVAFVHSNQRVIGSSKAENRMSRTALRDVFELNRYSQIPANLNTSETFQETDDVRTSPQKSFQKHLTSESPALPGLLSIVHPVTQTKEKAHQVRATTFLSGKTPKGICRKQLSEMPGHFKVGSLQELPKHILSSASTQRLTMLSNFHTTRHPELKDVLPDRLPESELEGDFTVPRSRFSTTTGCSTSEDANSSLIQELSGEETNHFRKQHLQERAVCFEMQNEINSEKYDCNCRPHNVKRNRRFSKEHSHNYCTKDNGSRYCTTSEVCSSTAPTKNKPPKKSEKSSRDSVNLQHSYKETGLSEKGSTCKSDNKQGIITQCKADSVTELLGDTSILDELFERRKPTALQPKKVSGHAPKGKTKSKDFWDFLNEASDGYVSALTDLSVTERLCESAPLNSKEREKGSLWKKNEKFLWKKDDPENDPGATTSGTSQLWKQNS
uniref:DNA excision repair protein ERCC-6-like 2 n=1 Tax=Callorhinchus milii TaxID=7868 RepID=A0A4W3IFW8_CALMI|eukprot:gi/632963968/ref/XP_007898171.1/ PREDICTED: putative DNA repair and recombination protein RAD26-like [Callorhinchus milii]